MKRLQKTIPPRSCSDIRYFYFTALQTRILSAFCEVKPLPYLCTPTSLTSQNITSFFNVCQRVDGLSTRWGALKKRLFWLKNCPCYLANCLTNRPQERFEKEKTTFGTVFRKENDVFIAENPCDPHNRAVYAGFVFLPKNAVGAKNRNISTFFRNIPSWIFGKVW